MNEPIADSPSQIILHVNRGNGLYVSCPEFELIDQSVSSRRRGGFVASSSLRFACYCIGTAAAQLLLACNACSFQNPSSIGAVTQTTSHLLSEIVKFAQCIDGVTKRCGTGLPKSALLPEYAALKGMRNALHHFFVRGEVSLFRQRGEEASGVGILYGLYTVEGSKLHVMRSPNIRRGCDAEWPPGGIVYPELIARWALKLVAHSVAVMAATLGLACETRLVVSFEPGLSEGLMQSLMEGTVVNARSTSLEGDWVSYSFASDNALPLGPQLEFVQPIRFILDQVELMVH